MSSHISPSPLKEAFALPQKGYPEIDKRGLCEIVFML
jgi:hypothetical protein